MTKRKRQPKYLRRGRCTQCGICCMTKEGIRTLPVGGSKNFNVEGFKNEIDYLEHTGWNIIRKTKRNIYLSKLQPCPQLYLTNNGKWRCKVHGQLKPKLCKIWPDGPGSFFDVMKGWCGYHFVKNPLYKPLKKKEVKKK